MEYSLREIPAGQAGTDATVAELTQLVSDAIHRPDVRLVAIDILRKAGVDTRDHRQVAAALYSWVQENIRYLNDPFNVETIQAPEVTLEVGAGDCDDHSALMAALAMSVGIPARFQVVGMDPDAFMHIYPELNIGGRWLPADTTESYGFGVMPVEFPSQKTYSLGGSLMLQSAAGVGLAGTFDDIWDDIRQDVRDAIKNLDFDVQIQLPEQLIRVETPVTRDAGVAAIEELFKQPLVWLVGGALVVAAAGARARSKKTKAW